MNFVILDLEWDNTFFNKGKVVLNEIIEFGAVKTDEDFNIIDEFSVLVKPKLGKFISKRTSKLTHLTTEMIMAEGIPFCEALSKFKVFLGDAVLLTWSTSDILTLTDNNKYYYNTNELDYIKEYVNAQTYCEKMLGCYNPAKQMGLSAAAEKLGIKTEDMELHRALDDSILTQQCVKKVYDRANIQDFVEDSSNPDFYRRLAFKPFYITNTRNPEIKNSDMSFSCPECGAKAKKKSKWEVKNNHIRASFKCSQCNKMFYGIMQFKVTFDGVITKKRTTEIPTSKPTNDEEQLKK